MDPYFEKLITICDEVLSASSSPSSESIEWQNLKEKINALKRNSAVIRNVNIEKFPQEIDIALPGSQITLGDLHGNALKLIYTLIRQGIMTLEKGESDYDILVKLYQKAYDPKQFTQDDFAQFLDILKRAKIDNSVQLRLIGDELCDRGSNDILTLYVLAKLSMEKAPLEIIYSNHGHAFLEFYENDYAQLGTTISKTFINSLLGLQAFLEQGIISKKELNYLIETIYIPNLKILSYSIDQSSEIPNITLFSHASVGITTIKNLALKFNVTFDDSTVYHLANTIDKINEKFAELVIDKEIVSEFRKELTAEYEAGRSFSSASPKAPIVKSAWFRLDATTEPSILEEGEDPRLRLSPNKTYTINWVHGHDDLGVVPESQQSFVRNLDNLLAKSLFYIFNEVSLLPFSQMSELIDNDYAIHYNFETSARLIKKHKMKSSSSLSSDTLLFSQASRTPDERKIEKEIKMDKDYSKGDSKSKSEEFVERKIRSEKEKQKPNAFASIQLRNPRKIFRKISEKLFEISEKELKESHAAAIENFYPIKIEGDRSDDKKDQIIIALDESESDSYSNVPVRGKILIDIKPPKGCLPDKAALETILHLHTLGPLVIEQDIDTEQVFCLLELSDKMKLKLGTDSPETVKKDLNIIIPEASYQNAYTSDPERFEKIMNTPRPSASP